MKQIALSVPSTTFPAVPGDPVRIRVRNLTGLDLSTIQITKPTKPY